MTNVNSLVVTGILFTIMFDVLIHIDIETLLAKPTPSRNILTALVLSSHGSDDKEYVATGRQITEAREERKRSRCFVRTLL